MNPSLLHQLSKRKKKTTKACDDLLPIPSPPKISKPVFSSIEKKLHVKDPEEIMWWLHHTKNVCRFRAGCRLQSKTYALSKLLSPQSLINIDGRPYARFFHGTRSQNLPKILKSGLRPIGGGALGRGFYMTPTLEKALVYTSKTQQTQNLHTFPIVLEIFVPNPENVMVCCLDRANESSCCSDGDLFTDYDELWQFLAKDQSILDTCLFDVWMMP